MLNEHTKIYLKKIRSNNDNDDEYAAVHIIRGDYIGIIHDILEEEYYVLSIQYILVLVDKNAKVYFFQMDSSE